MSSSLKFHDSHTRLCASSNLLISDNIRYTIIRRCNARNKYNTVTTTLFTDGIWPNKCEVAVVMIVMKS